MSMQNYANAGYVIPVSEMFPVLGTEVVERLKSLIKEQKSEEAEKILRESWPKDFPQFETVFVLNSEDESDDLTIGEMYIDFDESELYDMKPTPAMSLMYAKDICPVISKWVTFG